VQRARCDFFNEKLQVAVIQQQHCSGFDVLGVS
jgi:hypothetical protein